MIYYPTELVYYDDMYKKELSTTISSVQLRDNKLFVILDSTIFYPFGGGQPSDQGIIKTETGQASVKDVQIRDEIVTHECTLIEGTIEGGQDAQLTLDWERRHFNMRVHSAGHLIHDVLMSIVDGLTPVHGSHGSKPFLEYTPSIDKLPTSQELQDAVNEIIKNGRNVVCRKTDLDELHRIAKFIPPNLPRGKPLRMMQIEGFNAMPDGGTQVLNVSEIGKVEITSISIGQGKTTIKYKVPA